MVLEGRESESAVQETIRNSYTGGQVPAGSRGLIIGCRTSAIVRTLKHMESA